MSNVDVHAPVLYVRWKVSVPDVSVDKGSFGKYSCCFVFQSMEWRLFYYFSGSQHCMGLHPKGRLDSVPPYSIMLHVEDPDRRVLPALSSDLLRYESYPTFFWDKLHPEVEQAYPEFRNKREMNFLLILKADDFLTDDSSACTLCKHLITNNVPCLEGLSKDFAKLLDQGPNHDVEFHCGGQSVKAHQAVVSARSQPIASMLASGMIEGITKVVKIPDMKLETFKQFLEYLYTGSLDELSFEAALNLYEAGDKYAVHGLAKKCSKFLLEHLSVQNACELLVVADAHSDAHFKEAVVKYMLEHKVPLMSDCWQDFCNGHPMLAIPVLNQFCQKVPH